jgi:hypothetical protein
VFSEGVADAASAAAAAVSEEVFIA